jgi:cyclopropane fatty-acyl-phospholipid synthase-like methyltransferase
MKPKQGNPIDYADPKVRNEVLKRQREDMWSPEQVARLARHFRLKPGLSMLDAGCGFGYCLITQN